MVKMMRKVALIMAGGKGERFWPKSRIDKPKQFLDILGIGRTMLQITVDRINPIISMEDIFVVTNELYKDLITEQLPELPADNIICEPASRNTAPCIGLGVIHILNKYEDAMVMVLASDHLIKNELLFRTTLSDASEIAEKGNNIVTLGITPNYPEVGYGYVKMNMNNRITGAYEVANFVEKPDYETAIKYLEKGDYLWNSGMFVWKASTIMELMKELLPDIYSGLYKIQKSFGASNEQEILIDEYEKMKPVSIDYGIMEKAKDIYVIPGVFGWDDVGSWLAVERLRKPDKEGNVFSGNIVKVDVKNCIVEGNGRLLALIGVENLVVIDTEDALLIGDKDSISDIKGLMVQLKEDDKKKYL